MRSLWMLSAAMVLATCGGETELSQERIAQVHAQTLTLDTHIDIPLTYMTEIDPSGETDLQVDLPKLAKGKLDAGFWIIYTPQGDLDNFQAYKDAADIAFQRSLAIHAFVSKNTSQAELATTSEDVSRIVADDKTAVMMGMENAFPIGYACLESTVYRLGQASIDSSFCDQEVEKWAERGVRYVGITHFGHNQFGDSSNPHTERDKAGPRHGGLSEQGRALIGYLNDYGVMVDVSHAAKTTMMQAAELSRAPIIASHSGARAIGDSVRNLDDEQLRKIRDVGGVAQMVALGAYVKPLNAAQTTLRETIRREMGLETSEARSQMSSSVEADYEQRLEAMWEIEPAATVADLVDRIDHAVKVAGIGHVGIASDFDGGGGVVGWEDAAQTQNVTAELLRRGYNEADIGKIWSGNLLRVLDAAQAAAKPSYKAPVEQ